MNATIFGRIFWKEYRAQRAFWISMSVLTIGMELFCWGTGGSFTPTRRPTRFIMSRFTCCLPWA